MPNINKPFYALAYSALGAALPPMAFKAAEIVSGFSFSSVIWKLVWLVSIVSFIILAGSLLYIIIYVVPIEKLIYKAIHPIVCIFAGKDEVGTSNDATKSTEEISAANHSKDQTEEQFAQMAEDPLDERHAMFLPYVNEDCKELPSMPILDILDEVFKGNRQKRMSGQRYTVPKASNGFRVSRHINKWRLSLEKRLSDHQAISPPTCRQSERSTGTIAEQTTIFLLRLEE